VLAAYAVQHSPDNPLEALVVGERPEPTPRPEWSVVTVRAAALNAHDLWALRGVGLPAKQLPRILGADAAGTDEAGNDVVVYPVIPRRGNLPPTGRDPVFDPLLSEEHDGTLAQRVLVPTANLLPRPQHLSFEEAAALPTAWITAYRMLFSLSNTLPGQTVLVQGATGGVASALIMLGNAAGLRMWATTRDDRKAELARQYGAEQVFASGARFPERVDAVMETVGAATWGHSLKVLRPGGTLVVAGATAGHLPELELRRVFSYGLHIAGTRMGTLDEMKRLLSFVEQKRLTPPIDSITPLEEAASAFERMDSGDVTGKLVIVPPQF
jgi:NADPH:quinone reductase-like Zn-dependent oxidoreductase